MVGSRRGRRGSGGGVKIDPVILRNEEPLISVFRLVLMRKSAFLRPPAWTTKGEIRGPSQAQDDGVVG